jgi:GNS1/SUR4 family
MFLEEFAKKWHYYTYEMADPRSRDRFLMGSPVSIIALCTFYVVFNNYILKGFMRDRKPFDIRIASIAYNFYLMSACMIFSYKLSYFWFFKYNLWCEPVDHSNSEEALEVNSCQHFRAFLTVQSSQVVDICYYFLLVKISCVMESFLIEIGKKNVLRWQYIVIHHATLPFVVWVGTNYAPGGHSTFLIFILSLSAVIYVSYIVVVLTFPSWKAKLIWWEAIILPIQVRKVIRRLFSTQFLIMCIYRLANSS